MLFEGIGEESGRPQRGQAGVSERRFRPQRGQEITDSLTFGGRTASCGRKSNRTLGLSFCLYTPSQ